MERGSSKVRIEWDGTQAQAAKDELDRAALCLRDALERSAAIRDALDEANAGGEDKALNAAVAALNRALDNLRKTVEDADALCTATGRMIQLMDDTEEEVFRMVNGLEPGRGTQELRAGSYALPGESVIGRGAAALPLRFPEPEVLPPGRVSALGIMPGWIRPILDSDDETI